MPASQPPNHGQKNNQAEWYKRLIYAYPTIAKFKALTEQLFYEDLEKDRALSARASCKDAMKGSSAEI